MIVAQGPDASSIKTAKPQDFMFQWCYRTRSRWRGLHSGVLRRSSRGSGGNGLPLIEFALDRLCRAFESEGEIEALDRMEYTGTAFGKTILFDGAGAISATLTAYPMSRAEGFRYERPGRCKAPMGPLRIAGVSELAADKENLHCAG